jgi:signal transduction histidine kinase
MLPRHPNTQASAGQRGFLTLGQLNWSLISTLFFVLGLFLFVYKYLDFVARSIPVPPIVPLLEEITGVTAALTVFPICYLVSVRFPLMGAGWWRNIPIHIGIMTATSFVHTTLMAIQRKALWPVLGLGHYDYGYMPVRYIMEFANYAIVYCTIVTAIYLYHEIRFANERDLAQAQLEAQLSEAQLQNLRLQLEPHFLFNALNAISAVVYENPRVADEMIGRLSNLLRSVLKHDRSQEITLQQEIELLTLYVSVMKARMEDLLTIELDVAPETRDCLVPQLILQPLVENSIRHGIEPGSFRVHIFVQAERENGTLRIAVRDQGPGFARDQAAPAGIGLRNTTERIERLYGSRQRCQWRNGDPQGAVVELQIPFHTSP